MKTSGYDESTAPTRQYFHLMVEVDLRLSQPRFLDSPNSYVCPKHTFFWHFDEHLSRRLQIAD